MLFILLLFPLFDTFGHLGASAISLLKRLQRLLSCMEQVRNPVAERLVFRRLGLATARVAHQFLSRVDSDVFV
ncbi:hypothetical protein BC829DRAFT_237125 [Chytridium lagenaria]|nr:hypothetical protein BC829DRAFT_237125 [Chytridium lagenaria]